MKQILTLMSFLLCIQVAVAQGSISGNITDDEGVPLPGATVLVAGSNEGTTSDFDGNFSIRANTGDVLDFSYVGYKTVSVQVENQDQISVVLIADNELEEVVLTALGIEKKKDDDLSGTSVVEVDQLQRSGETGVLQGLSGKASGVQITRNSGDPGSGAYIQIRGQNTINGNNSPLIVLDGAPISNDNIGGSTGGVVQQSRLNDINPEDIESVSVIKGAAAAALYGTGAANGVLVINTKRGSKEAKGWSFNVKTSLSVDRINREWDKQDTWGQGYDGIWYDEPGIGYFVENTGFSFGDEIALRSGGADVYDTSGGYFETQSGRQIGAIDEKNSKKTYNQENRDAVFGDGYTWETNASFSYNSEGSSTYVSISNLDQQGIIQGASDYTRNTLKLNNDTQLTDKLKVKVSSTYTSIDSNRIQTGSNLNGLYLGYLRTSPDYDIRDYKGTNYRISDGVTTVTPNSHRSYRRSGGSYRTFNNETGSFSYAAPTYNNPLWTINEQKSVNSVERFSFAPELNYDVADNLKIVARYGIDFYQDNRVDYWPTGSAGDGSNGLWEENRISNKINNFKLFALGNTSITDDISLDYTVGYEANEETYRRLGAIETNFTNPDQVFLNTGNTTSENSNPDSYNQLVRKNGGFAVLDFSLFDDLLVQVSGRAETLSTLPGAGVIFYPSASVGYKITDLLSSDAVDFAKVRVSYGEVGIGANPYATSTVYGPGGVFSSWGDGLGGYLYGNPFTQSASRGNPDLKEERKKEYEFGLDLRLFDNAITLNATYYQSETRDGIIALPIPGSSGFTTTLQNAAVISNKGVEFDITGRILRTQDFGISVNANFTQNRNIVEDLQGSAYSILNGFTSTSSGIAEGFPYGVLRSGVYERDNGGNYVLNSNGFPNAAAEKEVGVGDPNANFRAGFGLNIYYKNLSLTSVIETSQGNDVWNGTYGVLHYFGIHENTAVKTVNDTGGTIVNSFGTEIPAGATFRGYIEDFGGGPVAVDSEWWTTNGGGFGDVGEPFIMDGSWIKMREVSLSYNFTEAFVQDLGLTNLSLSVSGRNLFLWSAIDGFDPENNLTGASRGRGLEYFSNPGTSSFLTTLRLQF
ncbi:MAG: SusC/RagA family TonB-linked outer membrane protein [Flavobacteriaceae bacterium]|nr:SusC/RagA family TonB-linked outer membrane protein [Flavobacteriaceae bacterium]MDG1912722.1 SusC/RagA family TonB-linked outer membrane protein [Flavobacteriaceae bacterium]